MHPPTAMPEPASATAGWPARPGRRASARLGAAMLLHVLLLLGLVLLAMSSVMIEAARVAEDNAGFV